jgi:diacylglycerol kinase family enzyme
MALSAAKILDERKQAYTLVHDEWPQDYSPYSSVWIFGGDGTLNYFINHAAGELPPLAIFKGGTGNDFACTLYGEAGMAEMVDIVLNAHPKKVDGGICNGQYFLNMAGIGFDGDTLRNMSTIRWMGSFIGYYLAIIKTIFLYREPEYSICINGHPPVRRSLLLLFANNAPSAGGGFKVSPLSSLVDGKLNLLLCEPLGIMKRLLKLSLIKKGRHLNESFISHEFIDQLLVETASPVAAQIDGELRFASRFEMKIIPGHFKFLY